MEPISMLALDPGVTTGWAARTAISDEYVTGQIEPHSQDKIWDFLESTKFYLFKGPLIVEDFRVRWDQHIEDPETPIKIIGVIQEWARQNEMPGKFQTPSQAKFFFKKRILQDRGLWKPIGDGHNMDALRHLMYYRQDFVK